MKPRILHITSGHSMGWTGGISATLHSLSTSRLAQQFDFAAVPLTEATAAVETFQPQAIVVHAACSWRNLKTLWTLRRLAPLWLNEHHYCANFAAYNVPSRTRFYGLLRLSYRLTHGVLAASTAQRDWMVQERLATATKIKVIQSSRIVDGFLRLPPKVRPLNQPLVLGAYGRLCHQKGFDVLIEAVKQLPAHTVVLYIGGTGSDETALKTLAANSPNIQFLGRIDDVPGFLQRCDAIAIPSRWEPWGNVCLEARAAGKPVIVAAVDGLCEQVQECGLQVPPENSAALAQAIQTLAQLTPAELSEMGQLGRQSAQDAWEIYLNRWQQVLEAIP